MVFFAAMCAQMEHNYKYEEAILQLINPKPAKKSGDDNGNNDNRDDDNNDDDSDDDDIDYDNENDVDGNDNNDDECKIMTSCNESAFKNMKFIKHPPLSCKKKEPD